MNSEHENHLKESLIKAINSEMKRLGNTDVTVENIRFFEKNEKQYALADISYVWWRDYWFHCWNKKIQHKDMIFVLIDNRWMSPILDAD